MKSKAQSYASAITLIAICCLTACTRDAGTVVDDAALADQSQGDNWLAYGRTYSEQRYSPLSEITDANVSELSVGMPAFAEYTEADLRALQHYIRSRAAP